MNTTNETNGTVTTKPIRNKTISPLIEEHRNREFDTVFEVTILTKEEAKRKKQLEKIIHNGWVNCSKIIGEMAAALLEIKVKKLYKASHKNWATYCAEMLEMSERGVRYALNRYEVSVILKGLKASESDVVEVTNGNDDQNRQAFPILDRELTEKEVKSVEPLEGKEKVEAIQKMATSPTPAPVAPRTPRMPPPRIVESVSAEPVAPKEPELQKPTCPLDNAQLNWVVHEIERCYIDNKAKWNKIPPPAPMTVVSAIQHLIQKWKV